MGKVIKKILKWLLLTLAALFGALILWLIVSSFYDEDLNPNFHSFFHAETPAPEAENAYLALGGIDAPSEAQMLEYGKTIFARQKDKPAGATYLIGMPANSALNCWTGEPTGNAPCVNEKQLSKLLADNQQFLKNYHALYRYQQFQHTELNGLLFGGDLIHLHQLAMAQLTLLAHQGHSDDALRGWLAEAAFTQHLMQSKTGLVQHAIFLVLYGQTAKTYGVMAASIPGEKLAQYQPVINQALDAPPFGAQGWDEAATMRIEQGIISHAVDQMTQGLMTQNHAKHYPLAIYKPNAMGNRFYDYAQDTVALTQVPLAQFDEAYRQNQIKHLQQKTFSSLYNTIIMLLYNPAGNLIVDGMVAGDGLYPVAVKQYTYRQMLKLYTDARIHHTTLEHMPAFIAVSALKNPETNQAFVWDPVHQTLLFIDIYQKRWEVKYTRTAH